MGEAAPPTEAAEHIFNQLGYDLTRVGNWENGVDFRARRKWRTVRLTVLDHATTSHVPLTEEFEEDLNLRCFVTSHDASETLRDRLERVDPPYEWAIVSVDGDGTTPDEYEVIRGDASPGVHVG